MTHGQGENDLLFRAFRQSLGPLREAKKLGCVLAQFPWGFRYSQKNLDLPLVLEFRNREWVRDEVFAWLKERGLGFCCVDEPRLPNLMPPLAMATSPIAYVRFHGRNAAKWWRHTFAYERYDYAYSDEELLEWVPKIRSLEEKAELTFVFGNNHYRGKAVNTIRKLKDLLETAA